MSRANSGEKSIPISRGGTQSSEVNPQIFQDARTALIPSAATQLSFTRSDGQLKPQSPHMVNVHQFYPEVEFTLVKGVVGELVETTLKVKPDPKTAEEEEALLEKQKKAEIEATNKKRASESKSQEITKTDAELNVPQIEETLSKKEESEEGTELVPVTEVTETTEVTEPVIAHSETQGEEVSDGLTDTAKEKTGDIFTTEVSEETIAAAQERQDRQPPTITGTYTIRQLLRQSSDEAAKPKTFNDFIHLKTVDHYQKALACMDEEEFAKAVIYLEKALNLMPNEVDFYWKRGECFFFLCDFQSAISNYKHACVLDPDNQSYYNRLAFIYYFYGQCLFDQKLFPESLECFSRAAEMRPDVVGYHTRSIACLAALERHGECLALVNKRLEKEGGNADLYILRARLHQLFRNTTLCYYDVKDALAIEPDHRVAQDLFQQLKAKALNFRAQAVNMSILNRPRDALEKISLAIETDPSVAEFHVFRGAMHRKLLDHNSAIDDFLLGMDKTDHDEQDTVYIDAQRQLLLSYNDFAVECFTKGFYEEAILLLNKAIKSEKMEKGLYLNRGDCFYKLNNAHYALSDYQQALELDDMDQETHKRIAIVHNDFGNEKFLVKQYKEAQHRFTLAIQHNPYNPQYYFSRARCEKMLQDMNAARLDAVTGILLDPNNPESIVVLSQFFPGKTMKDVLSTKLADSARHKLENLVITASPVKLRPISQESGAVETEHFDTTLPTKSEATRPQLLKESSKSSVATQKLATDLLREKQKLRREVKESLIRRHSLTYKGPRVHAMPDLSTIAQTKRDEKGHIKLIQSNDAKEETGWRKFSLGVSA